MTFQVGMIAEDGILLASDMLRRITGLPKTPARGLHAKKIVISKRKGLAYCCAGDDLAIELGRAIAANITAADREDLQGFFVGQCERIIGRAESRSLAGGSALVVLQSPRPQLWEVFLSKSSKSATATLIEKKHVIASGGDTASYAPFFLERYFPTRFAPSISALSRLAAHVILESSALNPTGIGGLEMVSCASSGFERFGPKQIDELCSFSYKLADDIRRKLGVARY